MCDKSDTLPELHCVDTTPLTSPPEYLDSRLSESLSSSLISLSDDENLNIPGCNLIEGARSEIISLRRQLMFERERCRQLEQDLQEHRQGSANQVEVVTSCVEQERADYQRLQTTVFYQKKIISELRRHLRIARTKFRALENCNSSLDRCEGGDFDSVFNVEHSCNQRSFESDLSLHHQTASEEVEHQTGMRFQQEKIPGQHTRDSTVVPRDCGFNSSQGMTSSAFNMKHGLDEEVLKRHLRAAFGTSTESLFDEHCAGSQETGSNKTSELCHNSCFNECDIEEPQSRRIARLKDKLKKEKQSSQQWRHYAERRNEYIEVLAQRCCNLELSTSRSSSGNRHADKSQLQKHALPVDEKRNAEVIGDDKKQMQDENRTLKSTVLKLGCEKRDVDTRLSQALSRLKSSESRRIESSERIRFLERQLAVYADDFIAEQRHRRLAQGRVTQLENQLANALRQLEIYQPGVPMLTELRANNVFSWTNMDLIGSSNDRDDVTTPSLIGRSTNEFVA